MEPDLFLLFKPAGAPRSGFVPFVSYQLAVNHMDFKHQLFILPALEKNLDLS